MDSNEFVIWLRGFVEASGTELSVTQLSTVKNKLKTVREVECGYSNPLIPPYLFSTYYITKHPF